ncbi:MAG TPA: calcium-translocating P-type ATPase, PMCA-type [Firmicutes bacterium]|nr:calcium-translocating P-type ATPase, PMCA-type [Bacillota bacterium]
MLPYTQRKDEILAVLGTGSDGLTPGQVRERLQQYGKNALREKEKKTLPERVWEQIKDPMVLILIAAALVAGLLGEMTDAAIILAVVVLNTVIGLVQESKAEQAIEALKKVSAAQAKVTRSGQVMSVPAEELVPGDIVLLEAGDMVPADLRLLESSSLRIEEASLTGESVPSEKDAEVLYTKERPIGDRANMAYSGSSIVYGRGRGVVTATGMNTEIGRIAELINTAEEDKTPLQRKLAEIGSVLTRLVLVISALIFATGLLKAERVTFAVALQAFLVAVSIAVAAIPEGLPAVVTVVMALGVTRMAKRKAIIRKLPAVETLGSAQIICSDKTGTLTQNKMEVRQVWFAGKSYEAPAYLEEVEDRILADILLFCNDAEVNTEGDVGDPTEIALKRFALLQEGAQERLAVYRRVDELPFDSDRKMMTTVNEGHGRRLVFTKGAPDVLINACTHIYTADGVRELTDADREMISRANQSMADRALRIIGAAYKPYSEGEELESGLIFAGLAGMMDPPRPEVYDAVERCKQAGIVPIMITGDHKATAVAVALDLGIIASAEEAITGRELDSFDEDQFAAVLDRYKVYARVSPEHKVRIVKAWKRRGKVVAMTGDGVNDAPSLKIADIGISMGITGTDVSKDVSDMLLADDNFATIVNAVEEGRKIYTNLRKAVQFLLSTNISEVFSLFIATLLLPAGTHFLRPVHILWINLVTDSLPAIGLGTDKAEGNLMQQPPRDTQKSFFADGLGFSILYQGVLIALFTLASYRFGYRSSPAVATTMAFVTLSTAQFVHSVNIKRGRETFFSRQSLDNPVILYGNLALFGLSVLIVNVEAPAAVFRVIPLSGGQWLVALLLAFAITPVVEVVKLVQRRTAAGKQ